MRCVICGKEIEPTWYGYSGGCNAEPVAEGRCCERCDQTVVMPARLKAMIDG